MKCVDCPYFYKYTNSDGMWNLVEYNCRLKPVKLSLASEGPNNTIDFHYKIGHTGTCECLDKLKAELRKLMAMTLKKEKKFVPPKEPKPRTKQRNHTWMEEFDDEDRPY